MHPNPSGLGDQYHSQEGLRSITALGNILGDFWRWNWVLPAMLVTVMTAAADEIHQTFIPSRTGRWQDVVLDTCGAAVLQVVVYFVSRRAFRRRREGVEDVTTLSAR